MSDTFSLTSKDIESICASAARYGASLVWLGSNKGVSVDVIRSIVPIDDQVDSITEESSIGEILSSIPKGYAKPILESVFAKLVISDSMLFAAAQISGRESADSLWDTIEENEELIKLGMNSESALDGVIEMLRSELKERMGEDQMNELERVINEAAKSLAENQKC